MNDYRFEKRECDCLVEKVIDVTPLITREAIRARDVTRPLALRKESLNLALLYTRALMDDMLLRQVRLGWRDEGRIEPAPTESDVDAQWRDLTNRSRATQ